MRALHGSAKGIQNKGKVGIRINKRKVLREIREGLLEKLILELDLKKKKKQYYRFLRRGKKRNIPRWRKASEAKAPRQRQAGDKGQF